MHSNRAVSAAMAPARAFPARPYPLLQLLIRFLQILQLLFVRIKASECLIESMFHLLEYLVYLTIKLRFELKHRLSHCYLESYIILTRFDSFAAI